MAPSEPPARSRRRRSGPGLVLADRDDGRLHRHATSPPYLSEAVAVDDRRPPAWVRPTILWTLGVLFAIAVAIGLLGALHEVITYLVLALFFSFAMEPAVNYMQARWHWKRGTTTALLLALVMLMGLLVILIFIPTVVKGASAIAERVSEGAGEFSTWASDKLGLDVSTASLQNGAHEASASLEASSTTPMSVLLGFTASLIGGIFAAFTVAMFIFYMVADAPRLKRSVLSFLPPPKQAELLSIWESAIEKTGGYFYSRLLLATINGGLFYVVLRIVGVPGAAALAFFEGAVAAFIPIIGTYIAAIVPLVDRVHHGGRHRHARAPDLRPHLPAGGELSHLPQDPGANDAAPPRDRVRGGARGRCDRRAPLGVPRAPVRSHRAGDGLPVDPAPRGRGERTDA